MGKTNRKSKPSTLHKNSLKMDHDIKCKTQDFQKTTQRNVFGIQIQAKSFLTQNQSMIHKRKNCKLDHFKIKNSCTLKDSIKMTKQHDTDQKKIFANYISAKGLMSKICEELSKINSKKSIQFLDNLDKRWEDTFQKMYRQQISI